MNTNDRPRILFLAREFTWGGAAFLAVRHMARLVPHCTVDLLVVGPTEERMLAKVPGDVSVFTIDPSLLDPEAEVPGGVQFALLHHGLFPFQSCYDAVLATSIFPDWAACVALQMVHSDRKIVFLVDEGLTFRHQTGSIAEATVEAALHAADFFSPVSLSLWERMALFRPELHGRPFEILRPPLPFDDLMAQKSIPRPDWGGGDLPVVLTVSRLSPDKQVLQCLQVHHRLRQTGVDFRWIVVGSGPERPALENEIERLGMGDRFLLAGNQEHVYGWMRHCDVFALLSSSEGCPTVVMEALVMGRPVIMTNVNGADELIRDGETGLIVNNTPEAIARGLSRLIGDAGLRERMASQVAAGPKLSDPELETERLLRWIRAVPPSSSSVPPRLSILIPTYRQSGLIGRAIASALLQDARNIEVVVLDDASPDDTAACVEAWLADPRLRYVRNPSNLGRVANYRSALTEHARGEWVLMLDGDDCLWDPGFVRRSLAHLECPAGKQPLFLQAGQRIVQDNGRSRPVDILPRIEGDVCLMPPGVYLDFVMETGFFTHLGTIYQRKAGVDSGFYRRDISSSDLDSLLRFSLNGDVLVSKTIAGCWFCHGSNASTSVPLGRILENLSPLEEAVNEAARRGLVDERELRPKLASYQRLILKHLVGTALAKKGSPREILHALKVIWQFDPKLLLSRSYARSSKFDLREIVWVSLRRWLLHIKRRCTR